MVSAYSFCIDLGDGGFQLPAVWHYSREIRIILGQGGILLRRKVIVNLLDLKEIKL
jgi:hypothetical protein